MTTRPMFSQEIAVRIGVTAATFRRNRNKYLSAGMPAPICDAGRPAWERSGMEAWLTRHHPHRPPPPANDVAAPPCPVTDTEHRLLLATAYGRFQTPRLDSTGPGA